MKEILTRARELLAHEGAWAQGDFARDAHGNSCDANVARAASWCLVGALERAAYDSSDPEGAMLECAMFALAAAIGLDTLGVWNDAPGRTREEVLHLLDRVAWATT